MRVLGRDLFGSLPSITLCIEPNGLGLMLTPDVMRALLASVPSPMEVGKDQTLAAWTKADDLPARVQRAWIAALITFPEARAAFWLRRVDDLSMHRRLVVLTSGDADTRRLLATMVVELRANYAGQMRIEAQAVPDGQLPEAQSRLGAFRPFYTAPEPAVRR